MTVFTSRFGFKWNYAPHDTGWGTDYNFTHRELAALLHPIIISDTVTTPPGSPAENDAYFVPSTGATGAWSTHANKIAAYQGGAWQYYTPEIGTRMRIVSRSGFYWWNGTALTAEATSGGGSSGVLTVAGHSPDIAGNVALVVADIMGAAPLSSPTFTNPSANTQTAHDNSTHLATTEYVDRGIAALGGIASAPYDISFFAEGALTVSEVAARFVVPRVISIAAGASGVAICGTAPTGTVVTNFAKNGSNFATATWAASATGTVSVTSTTAFAAGDVITWTGPGGTLDATFSDPSVTLTGTR